MNGPVTIVTNLNKKVKVILISLSILIIPLSTYAHPGNTASDGCHYCRTNCDKWGEVWDARHCHGGYTPTINDYEPPPSRPYTPPSASVTNTQNSYANDYSYADTNDTDDDSIWYIWFLLFGGGYWLWRKFKKQKVIPNTSSHTENKEVIEESLPTGENLYDDNTYDEHQEPDEDVKDIMESQDVDEDEAEEIRDLMDELGVDEDDAAEIRDAL